MGYSQTTLLVYGVEVPEKVAKAIHDKFFIEDVGCLVAEGEKDPCEARYGGEDSSQRYEVNVYSDGTDSRSDDLTYAEGYQHVFGVFLASKGYAYSEKTSMKLHDPVPTLHPLAEARWQKYCVPILKEFGLDVEPEIQIVSQVW